MSPENLRFGGGPDVSTLHPIALVAMLLTILLIFFLPRRYVIVPLFSCAILVPLGQQVVVGGIHLMVLRILILAGLLRMFFTKLSSPKRVLANGIGTLDVYFAFWGILAALAPVLLFRETGAVIRSFGMLLDAFGVYFLFRFLIQDKDDIYRAIKTFAWVCVIVAIGMSIEQLRHLNLFSFVGSAPLYPGVRAGRVRSQGPFATPILAGCFGATLFPLFYLMWKTTKAKGSAVIGAGSATLIMVAAASSTPLLAYAAGVFAIFCWSARRNMRAIRWGAVLGLVLLQLVMKAPVWYVVTHFHFVGGSSNYQRAQLFQQFFTHFSDWWLVGTNANSNWGWDMWDTSNQYVMVGETGGLATLLCFLGVIIVSFKSLGKARKAVVGDRNQEWFFWTLGAALFSTVTAFFGISYFDQTRVIWYALLAIISAATMPVLQNIPAVERSVALSPPASQRSFRRASLARPTRKGHRPLVSPR